jgi:glutamyl-tRNA synthetase
VFNPDKLLWMNGEYIKTSPPEEVAQALIPFLKQARLLDQDDAVPREWLTQLVVLVRERTKTLIDMVEWVKPYFGEAVAWEDEAAKTFLTPATAPLVRKLLERFSSMPAFSKAAWEAEFKRLVEEQGIKMGQLAQPVRVALTGRTASPGLFDVMEVLGRERTLFRLQQSVARAEASRA